MLGAGAWGTTLANVLGENGASVTLWCHRPEHAGVLERDRENRAYLPGFALHGAVTPTADMRDAVADVGLLLCAVPSHGVRDVLALAEPHVPGRAVVVSASKGIENDTLKRMSAVVEDVLGESCSARLGILSGPSFAREVSQRRPTAVTLAARQEPVAEAARRWLARPYLRVYTSTDVTGVELGGAVKNVIAIAAGVAEGLGAGHNGRAALITRGMAEIARLGLALGAEPLTLSGLAGMGDLILTCTSPLSRNFGVGARLGRGERLDEILGDMRAVAEGVRTARSVHDLARREAVEMPIVNEVHAILYGGKPPSEALADLMSRETKPEFWS